MCFNLCFTLSIRTGQLYSKTRPLDSPMLLPPSPMALCITLGILRLYINRHFVIYIRGRAVQKVEMRISPITQFNIYNPFIALIIDGRPTGGTSTHLLSMQFFYVYFPPMQFLFLSFSFYAILFIAVFFRLNFFVAKYSPASNANKIVKYIYFPQARNLLAGVARNYDTVRNTTATNITFVSFHIRRGDYAGHMKSVNTNEQMNTYNNRCVTNY